jgi:plasmid stabilization system protein ParE
VKRRFLLTPEAKADLRDILLDIAEDSPDAAERIRSDIYESFQRLGQSVERPFKAAMPAFERAFREAASFNQVHSATPQYP